MASESSKARDEARIRERIEAWATALRGRDLEGVMSHYAADVLVCDLAPPLQRVGADEVRKMLEWWFPTFRGPIGYEIRDLEISVGDDVAFSHSLNRLGGAAVSGVEWEVWVRATVCLRKIDGEWKITHEHSSVPYYMDGSFRAAVDLVP